MQVKSTVFGSQSERRFFYQLAERWQGKLNIWHNLAFRAVFDFDNNDEFVEALTWPQRNVLHTTSIDYVFCDPVTDQPVACVEFDGMSQGYSSGTSLFQRKPNQRRLDHLSVKLRFADRCRFPFFVISYNEAESLSLGIKFAIIDGVIGDFMARRALLAKMRSPLVPKQGEDGLEKPASLSIEDWEQMQVLGLLASAEYKLQLENNPVSQLLHETGYPFCPGISFQSVGDGLAQYECCLRYWDRMHQFGEVASISQLRIPRFQSAGYSSEILAVKILLLLAFDQAARKGITPQDIPPAVMESRLANKQGQEGMVLIPNKAYRGDTTELPDWWHGGFLSMGTVRPETTSANLTSERMAGLVVGLWWYNGYFAAIADVTLPE